MNYELLKISRSSLQHLRIPFSFFLLPVYLIALVLTPDFDAVKAVCIFVALHLFLYPGSSGFNAFYDRDTASVGMLKNPPVVAPDLLWLSLGMKMGAVIIAGITGPVMACGCLMYAVASILYSWNRVRLKKNPFAGWLLTGIGQGFVMLTAMVATLPPDGPAVPSNMHLAVAVCMALMMLAASPLLEIFQHEEDARRGDVTISRFVGIRGTLLLSAVLFTVAVSGLTLLMHAAMGVLPSLLLPVSLVPAVLLFVRLAMKVFRSGFKPDYRSMMPVALAASVGLNGYCLVLLLREFTLNV